jgi:hypothetical protein
MQADRLAQEARGWLAIPRRSQQEIDCVPCLVDGRSRYFHWPLMRTSVSSIRQLPPTRRLRARNAWSSNGAYVSTQQLRREWSTSTPRSSIISSSWR